MRRLLLLLALALAVPARADAPPTQSGTVQLNWRLLTALISGGRNNGWTTTCGESRINRLVIQARDAGGATATTAVDCPAADNNGWIKLPLRGRAPFTVSATTPNRAATRSEQVRGVVPGDTVTLRIYADGCDSCVEK